MTTPTTAQILSDTGLVVTEMLKWSTSIVNFAVNHSIILAFIGMGLFSFAVITVKGFLHN